MPSPSLHDAAVACAIEAHDGARRHANVERIDSVRVALRETSDASQHTRINANIANRFQHAIICVQYTELPIDIDKIDFAFAHLGVRGENIAPDVEVARTA